MYESLERHSLLPPPDATVRKAQQIAEAARRRREEEAGMRVQGLEEVIASDKDNRGVAKPAEVQAIVNATHKTDEYPILVRPKSR